MSKALVAVEQKEVKFYGDEVMAVRLADGRIMIPLRPIVERFGVNWSAQTRRVSRDPVLNEEKGVVVMATPGGKQEIWTAV